MTTRRLGRGWFWLLAFLVLLLPTEVARAVGAEDWDALFDSSRAAAPAALTTSTSALLDEGEPPEDSAPLSWSTTEGEAMHFTADYVEYDRKTGRVVLRGDAYATSGDMQLWADAVELEMGPGRIYGYGDVRFVRPQDDIEGETLDYNYKLRSGEMTEVETWRGPNRVVAERMRLEPYKLVAEEVYTTACDHTPPHYRIQARRGTLIPGKSLVLQDAALYWGRRRIIGFARYKASLRARNRQNFYLRPGYSSSRGYTIDAAYDFFFSDHEFGRILFEGTSDAGGRGGVAFRYGDGKEDNGNVRVFHNVVKVDDQNQLGSQFLDQTNSNASWTHTQTLGPRTKLNLNNTATRIENANTGRNDELRSNLSLSHDLPDYQLRLQVTRRVDLDGDSFTGDDTVPFLNQAPLVTLRKKTPLDLGGGFQLRLDALWGAYEERATVGPSRDVEKSELNLNLAGPALELGRTQIHWSLQQRLNWYSSVGKRDYYAFTMNGQTPLSAGREWELAYNYTLQRETGDTPFAFDALQDQQLVSAFLRQRRGYRFNATWFEAFRDLDRGEFRSAATNLFWHSPRGVRTTWSTGLNFGFGFTGERELDDIELRTISGNFRVSRGRWRHQAVLNWDETRSQLASTSLASDFVLDDKWRVQLATNYGRNGLNDWDRTRLVFALTRDLHAWEARLRVDVEQEEVFLEFYLKSQSKKPLGIRADFDTGTSGALDLDPFLGEKAQRPGPLIPDIPAP